MTTTSSIGFLVRAFKPFEKKTLRAFVSFELPNGMILHGCALHEKNGSRWIGLPAREYQKADNERSWTPLVEFATKAAREEFQAAALAAVVRHLHGGM
jgi:hypothetical protein